jgi:hypothetical protein
MCRGLYEVLSQGARFFFLHNVQAGFGAHPSSYAISTDGNLLGDKAAGA